jgi:hypothetical protein
MHVRVSMQKNALCVRDDEEDEEGPSVLSIIIEIFL